MANFWDERYAGEDYLFGEEPNAFLARQKPLLPSHGRALAVADGEGRNGVWLARQGLTITSIDSSAVAQEKARRLAARHRVALDIVLADLENWDWPAAGYEVVVGIFFQFAPPELRDRLFARMRAALVPGGLLLIEGYGPGQLAYNTGGPRQLDQLYTEELLRSAFSDFDILRLESYDAELEEGSRHVGPSALVDLVARKPL